MTAEIVGWLRDHSINLKTIQSEEDLSDLAPLKGIVGKSQVVGLGEATHGNKDFALIRDRIARFLIERMNFNGVIMEVPQEEAKVVDHYIQTGEGSQEDVFNGLVYWVFRTQEVLDLINWMRQFNLMSPKRMISFRGCDIPVEDERRNSDQSRDKAMAQNVLTFLEEKGPNSKFILWAHNSHIAKSENHSNSTDWKTMGSHLKDHLGDKYISFAALFNEGSFNARRLSSNQEAGPLEVFTVQKAEPGHFENIFSKTELPLAIFDLRPTRLNPLFQSWFKNQYKIREVGSVFSNECESDFSYSINLANKHDVVIWIDKVTPSRLI